MAEPFPFELVSPDLLLFSEKVEEVVVPGTDGEFGVMAGHAPVLSTLKRGVVIAKRPGGGVARFYVRGGFADASPSGLIIVAEHAIPIDRMRPDDIAQEIRNTEEDIADAKDATARHDAEERLEQLRVVERGLKAG